MLEQYQGEVLHVIIVTLIVLSKIIGYSLSSKEMTEGTAHSSKFLEGPNKSLMRRPHHEVSMYLGANNSCR